MVGWFRTVLIWLLVLALPAQGAAAATMAFCNPNHHATAGTVAHTQAHGHSATDSSVFDNHHLHVADAVVASASVTAATTAAVDAPSSKLVHADPHTCSACASCCTATAICSTVLNVPAPDVTPNVFGSVVATVEKFSSDGPDRPPRVLLV